MSVTLLVFFIQIWRTKSADQREIMRYKNDFGAQEEGLFRRFVFDPTSFPASVIFLSYLLGI